MSRKSDLFPCPECGGKLKAVIDSRSALSGVRRRRECVKGHRFTTLETVVPDSKQGHPVVSNREGPFMPIIQGGYL